MRLAVHLNVLGIGRDYSLKQVHPHILSPFQGRDVPM